MTNGQIASALDLGSQAIPALLSSIFSKLRAVSRFDAVLTAVQRGWIESGINEGPAPHFH
jgi:DNA-binding NarL/FixJ family response regulator